MICIVLSLNYEDFGMPHTQVILFCGLILEPSSLKHTLKWLEYFPHMWIRHLKSSSFAARGVRSLELKFLHGIGLRTCELPLTYTTLCRNGAPFDWRLEIKSQEVMRKREKVIKSRTMRKIWHWHHMTNIWLGCRTRYSRRDMENCLQSR